MIDKKLIKLKEMQDGIFTSISGILNAISSPVRIRLIHFLSQGPLSVEILANKIDQSVANTSMHLRKLLAENLVSVTTMGQKRLYTLAPSVFPLWESLQDFIQKIDPQLVLDVESVYEEMNWKFDLKATAKMIKNNEVFLLDVRPEDEVSESFERINVLNIPSSSLGKNLSKIPKSLPVLVFCRGRLCALSASAVNELRQKGIEAYRLNESWYSLKKIL